MQPLLDSLRDNLKFKGHGEDVNKVTRFLNRTGSLCLAPARHLFKGRTFTSVNGKLTEEINTPTSKVLNYGKSGLSLLLLIPSVIVGGLVKGVGLLASSSLREKYRAIHIQLIEPEASGFSSRVSATGRERISNSDLGTLQQTQPGPALASQPTPLIGKTADQPEDRRSLTDAEFQQLAKDKPAKFEYWDDSSKQWVSNEVAGAGFDFGRYNHIMVRTKDGLRELRLTQISVRAQWTNGASAVPLKTSAPVPPQRVKGAVPTVIPPTSPAPAISPVASPPPPDAAPERNQPGIAPKTPPGRVPDADQPVTIVVGSKSPDEEVGNRFFGTDAIPLIRGKIMCVFDSKVDSYIYVKITNWDAESRTVEYTNGTITKTALWYNLLFFPVKRIKEQLFDPPIELNAETAPGKQLALRSHAMVQSLMNFDNFSAGRLRVANKLYTPLTGTVTNISQKPVASCGSTTEREVILLDPDYSPELMQRYEALKRNLLSSLSEADILQRVSHTVKREILQETSGVEAFIENKRKDSSCHIETVNNKKVPFIPIDEFIKAKQGVCRHHALVMAFLLDKLIKDGILTGTVQHMRSNVPGGAHVWVTYVTKDKQYHIDSLWEEFVEFSQLPEQHYLRTRYGDTAMDLQMARTTILRGQWSVAL